MAAAEVVETAAETDPDLETETSPEEKVDATTVAERAISPETAVRREETAETAVAVEAAEMTEEEAAEAPIETTEKRN
jgi:hypothetical protein